MIPRQRNPSEAAKTAKSAARTTPSHCRSVYKGVNTNTLPNPSAALSLVDSLPLDTGSDVLNVQLSRAGVRGGRVLHLCGGGQGLQQLVLLNLCRAACERGGRGVYLDIAGALLPGNIERVGLTAFLDPAAQDEEVAPFRVLSPQTPTGVDESLRQLSKESPAPEVVVVSGLQAALERRFGGAEMRAEDVAKAGRVLHNLLGKYRVLCAESGQTLVLAHSPDGVATKGGTRRAASLAETVRGTMFAHCDFGWELGAPKPNPQDAETFHASVRAWRFNTPATEEAVLEMWPSGQFKNP